MHEDAHAIGHGVTVSDQPALTSRLQVDTSERQSRSNGSRNALPAGPRRHDVGSTPHVHDAALDALAARLRQRQETRYEWFLKPVLDRAIAAVLIVTLSPVLLLVALAVLTAMGRPVLFGQVRAGRFGRAFPMLKFRTMLPDRRRVAVATTYDGPERRVTHKSADDPRHTRLGRWMRKLSLDELPQLFNVLTGSMSLVGPRPEIYGMTADYAPWQHARHVVKPGVTGLWQTTERGKGLLLHECIDLDLRYIEHLSLREDLRILMRTPVAILRNRGVV